MTILDRMANDGAVVDGQSFMALNRLLFGQAMSTMEAWAASRAQLREQALAGCNLSLVHVQDLLYADLFSEHLFPPDLIELARDAAKVRMCSLERYLGNLTFQKKRQTKQPSRRAAKRRKANQGQGAGQGTQNRHSQHQQQQRQGGSGSAQGTNARKNRRPKKASKGHGGSNPSQGNKEAKIEGVTQGQTQ